MLRASIRALAGLSRQSAAGPAVACAGCARCLRTVSFALAAPYSAADLSALGLVRYHACKYECCTVCRAVKNALRGALPERLRIWKFLVVADPLLAPQMAEPVGVAGFSGRTAPELHWGVRRLPRAEFQGVRFAFCRCSTRCGRLSSSFEPSRIT